MSIDSSMGQGWPTRDTPLKKLTLPEVLGESTAPQAGVKAYKSLPIPCWNVDWFDLMKAAVAAVSSWILAVPSCPEDPALLWSSPTTDSYSLLQLLCLGGSLKLKVWYTCPICGWPLHWRLLSALCPVVSSCINHCPLLWCILRVVIICV